MSPPRLHPRRDALLVPAMPAPLAPRDDPSHHRPAAHRARKASARRCVLPGKRWCCGSSDRGDALFGGRGGGFPMDAGGLARRVADGGDGGGAAGFGLGGDEGEAAEEGDVKGGGVVEAVVNVGVDGGWWRGVEFGVVGGRVVLGGGVGVEVAVEDAADDCRGLDVADVEEDVEDVGEELSAHVVEDGARGVVGEEHREGAPRGGRAVAARVVGDQLVFAAGFRDVVVLAEEAVTVREGLKQCDVHRAGVVFGEPDAAGGCTTGPAASAAVVAQARVR
mmetsp:Transcript_2322/g.6216  ORF Transcript_2322/g.6216 Transcript_2322/m.6216 type:complete len:278 (+) Transcript_2322:146-979(+)